MKTLTELDFERAARSLLCDVAAVKAVAEVESPKGGFNPDGSVTTLFEAHVFSQLTRARFDRTNPKLSSPTWNRSLYGRNWIEEQARLKQAIALDPDAALQSASWGRFQIMGYNFVACGCSDIDDFVMMMGLGEGHQLDLFVNFVLSKNLDDEMQRQDWARFARIYNGPRYKENNYDTKLARAYAKFSNVHPEV